MTEKLLTGTLSLNTKKHFSVIDPRKLQCSVRLKRLILPDEPHDRAIKIDTDKKRATEIDIGKQRTIKINTGKKRAIKIHTRKKQTCQICGIVV